MPRIRQGHPSPGKVARKKVRETGFAALIKALKDANNFAQLKPYMPTLAELLEAIAEATGIREET